MAFRRSGVVRNCSSETLVAVQAKNLANFARPERAQARSDSARAISQPQQNPYFQDRRRPCLVPSRVGKMLVVFARGGLLATLQGRAHPLQASAAKTELNYAFTWLLFARCGFA